MTDKLPDFRTFFELKTGVAWDNLADTLMHDTVPKVADAMADYMDKLRKEMKRG